MDPDRDEAEVFLDTEEPGSLRADEEEEEEEGMEEEEEEEEDEEEDARIFNAWMQRYRGGERQEKIGEEKNGEAEPEGGRADSKSSIDPPVRMRADRRASLPCPVRKPANLTTWSINSCSGAFNYSIVRMRSFENPQKTLKISSAIP